ncbi:MAG TPA: endonuclease, partial [Candidatus Cloacimonas sp.]|nr:endonuclease [Candidatus Cloacimonas sp.]
NRMVFEPADEFKGNIARALLYFYTRYNGESLIQQNVNMLPTLLIWHSFDPPDNAELTRNIGVYNYQNNRNPYVDHPEFVGKIWGGDAVSDDVYLSIPELYINAVYPNPFVSEIAITISTKKSTPLTTSVYNMKGQLLYKNTQIMTSGDSKILWNGLDLQGKKSPAGIYIINVQSGNNQAVKKVLHL